LTGGHRLEFRGKTLDRLQKGDDPTLQCGASFGEFDPSARAEEEGNAERLLELGDLSTEGGLSDSEGFGGLPEMQVLRDRLKIDEVTKIVGELILTRHHRNLIKYFQVWQ